MVSKKMRNINYALGGSYVLILIASVFIRMAFPFEIIQEVITVDHQNNYAINNIMDIIVGLMTMFVLGHLGFMIGVAKTEESFKKI